MHDLGLTYDYNRLETRDTTDINEGMPLLEQAVDGYVAKLKEQAKSERGWAWGRDAVALPVVLQGAVWAVKTILVKSLDTTHGKAAVESMNPAEV